MKNTEIGKAFEVLIPEGNWGAFYGDATNAEEYSAGLLWNTTGTPPTWEQVKAVKIPAPTEPTVANKLAAAGLTIDELKMALGL
jgi:hypothetical protein